jgi:uncharacterized protein HemX
MNQRENETYTAALLLFLLVFLMLIAGAGFFGLYVYRRSSGAREEAIRMELIATRAAMVAEEQARLAKEAEEQMEKVQRIDEPAPQP